jgi:hypothetical protein
MGNINLKSKLINLSLIARRLGIRSTTLYNRVHSVGRHSPLTEIELNKIEQIIKTELYGNLLD